MEYPSLFANTSGFPSMNTANREEVDASSHPFISPFASLPLELVLHIIELAARLSVGSAQALSLVSRQVHTYTLPALYHTVVLKTEGQTRCFNRTMKAVGNGNKCRLVKILQLHQQWDLQMLQRLSNLRGIVFDGNQIWGHRFLPTTESLDLTTIWAGARPIHFTYFSKVSITIFQDFKFLFSKVTHLYLSESRQLTSFMSEYSPFLQVTHLGVRLTHMSWKDCIFRLVEPTLASSPKLVMFVLFLGDQERLPAVLDLPMELFVEPFIHIQDERLFVAKACEPSVYMEEGVLLWDMIQLRYKNWRELW
ncbi:hypothetical protein K439DRAFT_1134017 [Ramaria rubella]|nr:hypothetical protein K439DRAFT_1134017 [Ramaria rubella]